MNQLSPKAAIDQKDAWLNACNMERPLERIRQFTAALARLAPTIDDNQAATIVQELTLAIEECLDEVDESYGFFFHLHHPDRERFERAGWPEQAVVEAT
jgi:hypothetical protein